MIEDGEIDWNVLGPDERPWAKLQPFLKSRGYLLRRRYQPSWKPRRKHDHRDETTLFSLASRFYYQWTYPNLAI
jgi:hypothetical protein